MPIITRPPNFPPPKPRTAQQYGRRQTQPRKAVEEGEASSGESDEEGDEDFEAQVRSSDLPLSPYPSSSGRQKQAPQAPG